jgi:hypothetical protein
MMLPTLLGRRRRQKKQHRGRPLYLLRAVLRSPSPGTGRLRLIRQDHGDGQFDVGTGDRRAAVAGLWTGVSSLVVALVDDGRTPCGESQGAEPGGMMGDVGVVCAG